MSDFKSARTIERRIGELHIIAARDRALRLVAFTGSVFAGEWSSSIVEPVTLDLVEFAYHARRINQLLGFESENLPSVASHQVHISENDPGSWIENYQWALNRIMHMESYVLGWAHVDHRKVYLAAESNVAPLYVRVSSDRYPSGTVSIFGVASCFLMSIIPLVKERFPHLRF